jgi:hypothetical protein
MSIRKYPSECWYAGGSCRKRYRWRSVSTLTRLAQVWRACKYCSTLGSLAERSPWAQRRFIWATGTCSSRKGGKATRSGRVAGLDEREEPVLNAWRVPLPPYRPRERGHHPLPYRPGKYFGMLLRSSATCIPDNLSFRRNLDSYNLSRFTPQGHNPDSLSTPYVANGGLGTPIGLGVLLGNCNGKSRFLRRNEVRFVAFTASS